jgi:RHS repeat-associated protein
LVTVLEVYFWDGWQTVEETDASGTLQKQYVYGEGLDEVVRANLPDAADVDGDTNTSEKVDLFFHHNSLGSVVAVTDAAGTVKESYRYSAFGQPTFFNASGVEVSASAVKQPFLFTGALWDEESGLYQMRLRYYDPVAGRFVSRDPLGLWGDMSEAGNGQNYCSGDPVNRIDPMGLFDVLGTLSAATGGSHPTAPLPKTPQPGPKGAKPQSAAGTILGATSTSGPKSPAGASAPAPQPTAAGVKDSGVMDTLVTAATAPLDSVAVGTAADPRDTFLTALGQDPQHNDFVEDALEFLVDITWGAPNTAISLTAALLNFALSPILVPIDHIFGGGRLHFPTIQFHGNDIVTIEGGFMDYAHYAGYSMDVTFGAFGLMDTGGSLQAHMEGHHDQTQMLGPAFLFVIGPSSFFSFLTGGKAWCERWADDLGRRPW